MAWASCPQRAVGLVREARRELQAELAEADAAHSVVTRTASKGHLLGLLDVVVALRGVRDLPASLRCPSHGRPSQSLIEVAVR